MEKMLGIERGRNQVCLADCVPEGVFAQSEQRRSRFVGKTASSGVVLRSVFLWGCSYG